MDAEEVDCIRVVRFDGDRPIKTDQGVRVTVEGHESAPAIEQCFGIVRLDCQRSVIVENGFIMTTEVGQREGSPGGSKRLNTRQMLPLIGT